MQLKDRRKDRKSSDMSLTGIDYRLMALFAVYALLWPALLSTDHACFCYTQTNDLEI